MSRTYKITPSQQIRLIVEAPDGGRAEVIGTLTAVTETHDSRAPAPLTLEVKGSARPLPAHPEQ